MHKFFVVVFLVSRSGASRSTTITPIRMEHPWDL
jgi:hypothetical protein